MKNNFRKNWSKIVLLVVLILGAVSSATYAEFVPIEKDKENQDPYFSEGLSVAKCFEKGNLEFGLFLNTLIYNDGFSDGVIEPWKDILKRNQCHAMDVMGLIKQQDKVRKYIRDAFLTCKTEKLPAYKRAFNEINAEIYYVRHVVDGAVIASLPYDLLTTRMLENEESLFYPREKLYQEMKTKYVDSGDFTQDDFDILFANLQDKYADRKNQYVLCESNSWEVVGEKYDEFKDSFKEIGQDFKNDIGGEAEKIREAAGFDGGFPIESFGSKGLSGFLGSVVQTNFNKQSAQMSFSELSSQNTEYSDLIETLQGYGLAASKKANEDGVSDEAAKSSSSSVSGSAVTVDQLLNQYNFESKRFDTQKQRLEMSAYIESNYGSVSDQVIEAYILELDRLNATIRDAYPYLSTIKECANTMNAKQCVQ